MYSGIDGIRYSGEHDPHQDDGDYGRGRGEAFVRHQFQGGSGYGADLAVEFPGLRIDRIFYGEAVYGSVLSWRTVEFKEIREDGEEERQLLF